MYIIKTHSNSSKAEGWGYMELRCSKILVLSGKLLKYSFILDFSKSKMHVESLVSSPT